MSLATVSVGISNIIRRLLKLQHQPNFKLSNIINPVLDVKDFLWLPYIFEKSGQSVAATGAKTIVTVPKHKRYYLRNIEFDCSGAVAKCDNVSLLRPDAAYGVIVEEFTEVNAKSVTFNPMLRVDPEWYLRINCSTADAAQTMTTHLYGFEVDV